MPAWVAGKQRRLAKIQEAKAALEAAAKAAAQAEARRQEQTAKGPGRKPKPPSDRPVDQA
jgi:hypothetical protein